MFRTLATDWAKNLRSRSLRSLLILGIGMALMPIFVISFLQAYARLAQDRMVVRASLVDNVSISAQQASHVIESSEQALFSLSERMEVREGTGKCTETLAIARLGMPYVINLARVDQTGKILCSAEPILTMRDLSRRDWWRALAPNLKISYIGPIRAATTGKPVLVLGLGLRDQNGQPKGHIVLGVDVLKLQEGLNKRTFGTAAHLTLVDGNGLEVGQTTSASRTLVTLPKTITEVSVHSDQIWSDSVQTIVPGHLYVRFSMPDRILFRHTLAHIAIDIALPLIALILACASAWLVLEFWAIKPIEQLRTLAKDYTSGTFSGPAPGLLHGPLELIELRDQLAAMAAQVELRDENLKSIALQKDSLVRELHHRVKNNIQVVLSLLSLQARQLTSPQDRAPLERVQSRITALALVQRLIVETDDVSRPSTIDVQLLSYDLCRQVRLAHQSRANEIKISSQCDPLSVSTDMAVPISLFIFEAVNNAVNHAFPEGIAGEVKVEFAIDQMGLARLEVSDNGIGWRNDQSPGTGHSLLMAFGRQLGGHLNVTKPLDGGTKVSVSFLIPGLIPGIISKTASKTAVEEQVLV